jgi:hypothetical protein
MAFYLNTQHGLTEYQLGDFISNPVRAFFLVSDEELTEQDYEITYADGETSIVVMKNILVKNNQYYYSLPWKFIQSIDVYQITNPDFYDSACCSNFNMTLDVLYGQSETVNQVSATGGPDGTLCWNGFGFFGAPKTYIISFGEEYLNGGLTLNISAIVDSHVFRYTTETGDCYEGILESPHPYVNVFQIVNNNDDASDDNEEPNFSDADEPIFSDDPTPTPVQPTPTPTPMQLDGLTIYTSEPNGYFKYTVENKSSNSDFNDSKYFYEVKRAFDQWDSVITESPYTIIENQESVSWNLEVAVEFDSLESGTLGGAMLSEVLTINENHEFKFGETFPTKGDFILSTSYLDYLYSETDVTGNTQLFSVTLHEIGHLLGIGYITFYHLGIITDQPIVSYTDTTENVTKRYYTGTNGLTAYNEYFSNGNNNLVGIPIEDDGGDGTAHVHAEEGHVDYGYGDISSNDRYINNIWHPGLENELMTGWSEDDASMPMSKITLGLLEDIGFSINYDKVEMYNATPTSLSS